MLTKGFMFGWLGGSLVALSLVLIVGLTVGSVGYGAFFFGFIGAESCWDPARWRDHRTDPLGKQHLGSQATKPV